MRFNVIVTLKRMVMKQRSGILLCLLSVVANKNYASEMQKIC